jgi:molybdopterin synthase sulfur carrier subunit
MPEKSPITVTVKFFGGIRHTAGFARMPMTFSGQRPNVGDLLGTLAARLPAVHRAIEKGVKGGYINVLLNGRNIRFLSGLATPLADGDALAFLPPVGGG